MRRSEAKASTANAAARVHVAAAGRSQAANPSAPTAQAPPSNDPPTTAPATYQSAVTQNRCPRARSATGFNDDSMDSPHGDHRPRTAATTTVRTSKPSNIASASGSVGVRVPDLHAARVDRELAAVE